MSRQTIINEIIQINGQYDQEVERSFKSWPKSIRDRVVELLKSGMRPREVSEATKIPYYTVLRWRLKKGPPRKRRQEFKELAVTSEVGEAKVAAVAAPQELDHVVERAPEIAAPTYNAVTVATQDGYRINVPTTDLAVEIIIKLRQLGG
jgi:hypothetical protein